MTDLGIQPHIVEQVLNHQSGHKGGIAGIYNRSSYAREVRAALVWADTSAPWPTVASVRLSRSRHTPQQIVEIILAPGAAPTAKAGTAYPEQVVTGGDLRHRNRVQ